VDPKTILCQFYKKGHCDKGRKCKFSHDLAIERKTEKRSLYTDTRDEEKNEEEEAKKKDAMDDWDEEKLQNVILSKHGNPKTTTDKVCKSTAGSGCVQTEATSASTGTPSRPGKCWRLSLREG
jgi:hypothetical protein